MKIITKLLILFLTGVFILAGMNSSLADENGDNGELNVDVKPCYYCADQEGNPVGLDLDRD